MTLALFAAIRVLREHACGRSVDPDRLHLGDRDGAAASAGADPPQAIQRQGAQPCLT
jgi:hypothetical protein